MKTLKVKYIHYRGVFMSEIEIFLEKKLIGIWVQEIKLKNCLRVFHKILQKL